MANWTMTNLIFRDDMQTWTADIAIDGITGVDPYTQNIMNIPVDKGTEYVKAYIDAFVRDQETQLTTPEPEVPQDIQSLVDNPQNVG